jgi:uncharacterized membrane protein YfcA
LAIGGLVIGFINGFFGGGGGMICVPVLAGLVKLPTKKAHATAILVILPISIVSSLIYFIKGTFDAATGIPSLIGVVAGGALGALLLSKLSNNVIRAVFAAIMIIAGIKMIF